MKKEETLSADEKITKFTSSSSEIKLNNIEISALWNRTSPISAKNPNIFRMDPAEALIKLSDFGKKTPFGWVIQPMNLNAVPAVIDINCVIAIHWMNAESRLKTSNEKSFTTVVTRSENPLLDENIKKEKTVLNKNIIRQGFSAVFSKVEYKKNI